MNRYSFLVLLILCTVISLFAEPTYCPRTTLVETISADWCSSCSNTYTGMGVLQNLFPSSELLSLRYYTQSGTLSNPASEARAIYYNVGGVPDVIFNGKVRHDGGGEEYATGQAYLETFKSFRFTTSPFRLAVTNWNPTSREVAIQYTVLDPSYLPNNDTLRIAVVENNVTDLHTQVVRGIYSTEVLHVDTQNVTYTFNPDLTSNWGNTHIIAFIQRGDKAIMQSASSLPSPTNDLRVAVPFEPTIVGEANTNFLSTPFAIWNLGASANYSFKLVRDDTPEDWYINFCNEEGACFPGGITLPLSLAAGEYKLYHLNLIVADAGLARFHFEITGESLTSPIIVPFVYTTSVANDDPTSTPIAVSSLSVSPNPSSSISTIRVKSNKPSTISKVSIYDIKGRLIYRFPQQADRQAVSEFAWNGTDTQGRLVGSGVYLVKVTCNGQSITQKLVRIK